MPTSPRLTDSLTYSTYHLLYSHTLKKVRIWFRDYKIPDGKPANEFGYDNKALDKAFTDNVIAETHEFYNRLKSGRRENTEELSLI